MFANASQPVLSYPDKLAEINEEPFGMAVRHSEKASHALYGHRPTDKN